MSQLALLAPALLAPVIEPPLPERILISGVLLLLGVVLVLTGRMNLSTGEAEESGKRAFVLSLLGRSTKREGRSARLIGWVRIVSGALIVAFAFVFLAFGTFLKD